MDRPQPRSCCCFFFSRGPWLSILVAAISFLLVLLLSLAFSFSSPLPWFATQAQDDAVKFFTLFGTLGFLTINGISLVACDDMHGLCCRDCFGGTINFCGFAMKLLAIMNTVTYILIAVESDLLSLVLCEGFAVTFQSGDCTADWEPKLFTALLVISLAFQWLTAWTTGSFFGLCDGFVRMDRPRKSRRGKSFRKDGLTAVSATSNANAKQPTSATRAGAGSTSNLAEGRPTMTMEQHVDSLAKFAKTMLSKEPSARSGRSSRRSRVESSSSDDDRRALVDHSRRKPRASRSRV